MKTKNVRRLAGWLMLLSSWAISLEISAANHRPTWSGVVTHVTDGDTVWVKELGEPLARQIRIDGIDAPEICQTYGEHARAALIAKALGQQVLVHSRRMDQYGRLLATLSLNGHDLGEWMVSQGQAWSYHFRRHAGPYALQEAHAQSLRLGLFADGRAERPRDFRKRHGSCH
jgi:endonuclease YncB( thermonuclease family)